MWTGPGRSEQVWAGPMRASEVWPGLAGSLVFFFWGGGGSGSISVGLDWLRLGWVTRTHIRAGFYGVLPSFIGFSWVGRG